MHQRHRRGVHVLQCGLEFTVYTFDFFISVHGLWFGLAYKSSWLTVWTFTYWFMVCGLDFYVSVYGLRLGLLCIGVAFLHSSGRPSMGPRPSGKRGRGQGPLCFQGWGLPVWGCESRVDVQDLRFRAWCLVLNVEG